MSDEDQVKALMARYADAVRSKDGAVLAACHAEDAVSYDLAPPLQHGAETLCDPRGSDDWFQTWQGEIAGESRDERLFVGGDVAFAHALRRMQGVKTDGYEVDLWFRSTLGFVRRGGAWRIVHVHASTPFAMDGSGRALLDLTP